MVVRASTWAKVVSTYAYLHCCVSIFHIFQRMNVQSNLTWQPPLGRDHLPFATRSGSNYRILLCTSPFKDDNLSNATTTATFRSKNEYLLLLSHGLFTPRNTQLEGGSLRVHLFLITPPHGRTHTDFYGSQFYEKHRANVSPWIAAVYVLHLYQDYWSMTENDVHFGSPWTDGQPTVSCKIGCLQKAHVCWYLSVSGPLGYRLVIHVLFSSHMILNACVCRVHPCFTSLAEDVAPLNWLTQNPTSTDRGLNPGASVFESSVLTTSLLNP